ncbi:hypothetical protein PR002_g6638 [Phytophthora rubi]|uniref:Uncharacterized protein n=1 Tax=Phytophthora rubi TaxID=129364 RepID=A0A6A3N7S0_9STRA|nr:hypothetical protein PR002_g6638 [Phytophthora rubi]
MDAYAYHMARGEARGTALYMLSGTEILTVPSMLHSLAAADYL